MRLAKIIIVEDEPYMQDQLRDTLEEEGYWVKTAGDGPRAIEQIKKAEFNLAVIDLRLPGINGLQLMDELKRTNPRIIVILITGYASVETAIQAIRHGAYDYMIKPFDPSKLIMAIGRGLEKQRLSWENEKLLESLKERRQQLEKAHLATLRALAAIIDARNCHTSLHSEHVTKYSLEIATSVKLSTDEREKLQQACQLHDIGKIAIPDSILSKPGKLTEDEWVEVKTHPARGADILGSLEFLSHVIPLVKHHHERYDGSGYPDKLSGEAIPLGARIMAVADAFDAMTSDRPYRKALNQEKALEEIKRNTGTQFDPSVAESFVTRY